MTEIEITTTDGMIPWDGTAPQRGEGRYVVLMPGGNANIVLRWRPAGGRWLTECGSQVGHPTAYHPSPIDLSKWDEMVRAREEGDALRASLDEECGKVLRLCVDRDLAQDELRTQGERFDAAEVALADTQARLAELERRLRLRARRRWSSGCPTDPERRARWDGGNAAWQEVAAILDDVPGQDDREAAAPGIVPDDLIWEGHGAWIAGSDGAFRWFATAPDGSQSGGVADVYLEAVAGVLRALRPTAPAGPPTTPGELERAPHPDCDVAERTLDKAAEAVARYLLPHVGLDLADPPGRWLSAVRFALRPYVQPRGTQAEANYSAALKAFAALARGDLRELGSVSEDFQGDVDLIVGRMSKPGVAGLRDRLGPEAVGAVMQEWDADAGAVSRVMSETRRLLREEPPPQPAPDIGKAAEAVAVAVFGDGCVVADEMSADALPAIRAALAPHWPGGDSLTLTLLGGEQVAVSMRETLLRVCEYVRPGILEGSSPRWSLVSLATGHGSGYSSALCVALGLNHEDMIEARATPEWLSDLIGDEADDDA